MFISGSISDRANFISDLESPEDLLVSVTRRGLSIAAISLSLSIPSGIFLIQPMDYAVFWHILRVSGELV
jgi:hypothetical protein